MLLGNSFGEKRDPFVMLMVTAAKNSDQQKQNNWERHGFGRTLWRDVVVMQDHMQVYGNAKGTHMQCIFAIFDRLQTRCSQNSGWWNGGLSVSFLRYHFAHRGDSDRPVLLFWDDCSGHWTEEVISYAASINVVLMRVARSATSVCQPADVAWNKLLKQHLRACWTESLRQQLKARDRDSHFKLVPSTRAVICDWVCLLWVGMEEDVIKAGFRCARLPVGEVDVVDNEWVGALEALHLACDEVGSDDGI